MAREKPRIFIGLIEAAGYFGNLCRGFRELGVPCTFYDIYGHRYRYRGGSGNPLVRLHRHAFARLQADAFPRPLWRAVALASRLALLGLALARYDVFIFGCASTFLRRRELPLLKLLGKTVVFVFLGTDARPTFISGNFVVPRALEGDGGMDWAALRRDTAERKAMMRVVERYADQVVNHPPTAHFQTRPFVSFMTVGFPFDLQPGGDVPPAAPRGDRGTRILHAPSFAAAKGTAVIRGHIESLRRRGHVIDYVEIVDRPHREVLEALAACDFVVDELYADIPLGGLGTEAAFFGKPTVNGGYYAEMMRRDYRPEEIPPALYCLPEQLEQAIEALIVDAPRRRELGAAAQRFVRERWSVRAVAGRYLRIIDGSAPAAWYFDPRDIAYLHGYGLAEASAKRMVRGLVERYGRDALQVSDKPELLERFLRFAGEADGGR